MTKMGIELASPSLQETFRRTWRGLGASVAVISTEHGGKKHAMLATAVTSVSMDPPSLQICVNRSSSLHAPLSERQAFAVNILAEANGDLAAYFASSHGEERFSQGDWRTLVEPNRTIDNLPWLSEAQATVFCKTAQTLDFGSHRIHIGLVEAVNGCSDALPLLYCQGSYGSFRQTKTAQPRSSR